MRRVLAVLSSSILALTTLALADPARAADILAAAAVGNLAQHVAISPDGSTAYVTNSAADSVSVVSVVTGAVGATVPVGDVPQDVVVTADGSRVFVANRDSNTISVINTATNTVTGTIAVAGGPDGLALSPDGSRLYVTLFTAGRVSAIDTATLTEVAGAVVGGQPNSVAVSDDGAFAFTANRAAGTVSVLGLPALTVVGTVAVGPDPYWVETRGAGPAIRVYATNFGMGANSVREIAQAPGGWAVARTLLVPGRPIGVALSADGATLYVTQYQAGAVAAVKVSNGAITATTAIQPGLVGIAVTGDGSRCVVVRYLPPSTATIIALVPRVTVAPAEDVKGKTATGTATVITDAGGASDIRCLYSRDRADLADPYTSTTSSVTGSPATVGASRTAEVTCAFEDLKRGREYFYTAVASDSDGMGAATTTQSFTTRPPTPDDPTVTRKRMKFILRWDEVRSATYYEARIRKGGSYKSWRTLDQPEVVFRNLQRETSYTMQIRAGNDSGAGPELTLKRKTK